ncbi:alpha/beta fold hydrolase [Cryptosporangium sp. NPDC051539]|uniref:alpha/beta fold hydrolase n=1 Tax=Cryptosporangium sp. NPDC051539 TaxID=3363962 RepID=UPI0037A3C073
MAFVLVHGAGMGAACWKPLLPELDGPVLAVDLPGRGSRASVDVSTVTLDDCARALIADVEQADLHDVVLVAHSFAGVVVPRVLPALAGRLRHVVFLSAVVPPEGTSVLDQIDPAVRAAVEQSISGGVYHQTREGAEAMLCNDLDDEATAWTLDQVTDDSAALLTEVVDLSGLRTDVPRTYVRLTRDMCYPPQLQEPSAARVGGNVAFLDSGHMAMVAVPGELAALLATVHG